MDWWRKALSLARHITVEPGRCVLAEKGRQYRFCALTSNLLFRQVVYLDLA